MGMYTELHLNAEISNNAPPEVLAILRFMVGEGDKPDDLPTHPLFGTERWQWMLTSDSYYFDADTISTLRHDDIAECHYLCVRCNLKNYSGEIQHFVDWLMPYLADNEEGRFLGFWRYETDEDPTLIRCGARVAVQP